VSVTLQESPVGRQYNTYRRQLKDRSSDSLEAGQIPLATVVGSRGITESSIKRDRGREKKEKPRPWKVSWWLLKPNAITVRLYHPSRVQIWVTLGLLVIGRRRGSGNAWHNQRRISV